MPELKQSELPSFLKKLKPEAIPPVFFVWGEEFLCRKVFDAIIAFLLPEGQRGIGYELLEGDDATVSVVIERLSTYSIFQEKRVVAIKNAPIFIPPGTAASAGFTPEAIEQLKALIEKGFPETHFLVMTSATADRRRLIFNTLKEFGVTIDCTVPKGNRKADQGQKTEFLRSTMKEILDRTGKGIDGHAFNQLSEMTGFDPATFADNLERLVSFIGERTQITADDVQSIVKRTRKDAIFELTNAVSDRKVGQALFFFKSLCESGFYPLQLLAALTNHIRKILVVKEFILSEKAKGNSCWQHGTRNYNQFMKNTMPFVIQGDGALSEKLQQWEQALAPDGTENKKKITTDLAIAPNPKNGYPVFQMFVKSDNFSRDELISIFLKLSELDHQMKTSSDSDPFILLEALIIGICTPAKK